MQEAKPTILETNFPNNTFFLYSDIYKVEDGSLRVDLFSRDKLTSNNYFGVLKTFGLALLTIFIGFVTSTNVAVHIAAVIFGLLFALWGILELRKALRESKFNNFNVKLLGTLDNIRGYQSAGGRYSGPQYWVYINFSFVTPAGQTLESFESSIRMDLKDAELPPPGTPVVIRYLNDKLFEIC